MTAITTYLLIFSRQLNRCEIGILYVFLYSLLGLCTVCGKKTNLYQ